MDLDKLPFNWFDILLGVMLLVGIQRGRARGMSEEIFSVLTWVSIAFVGAFAYEPIGNMLVQNNVANPLGAYMIAYVVMAFVIFFIFAAIKRSMSPKMSGSDVFGRGEFYLGMAAGVVRFSCILIAGMALLNARLYAPAEIRADISYQNDVYGSDFFPKLYSIQGQVFEQSMSGPWIKKNLAALLIKPTAAVKTGAPPAPGPAAPGNQKQNAKL